MADSHTLRRPTRASTRGAGDLLAAAGARPSRGVAQAQSGAGARFGHQGYQEYPLNGPAEPKPPKKGKAKAKGKAKPAAAPAKPRGSKRKSTTPAAGEGEQHSARRPRGRAPAGQTWNERNGEWEKTPQYGERGKAASRQQQLEEPAAAADENQQAPLTKATKVAELKSRLAELGLDTSGKKQELYERLQAATAGAAAEDKGVASDHPERVKQQPEELPAATAASVKKSSDEWVSASSNEEEDEDDDVVPETDEEEQAERDRKQAWQEEKKAAPAPKASKAPAASATAARISLGTPSVTTGAVVPAPIDREEDAQRMERIKQERLARLAVQA